MADNDLIFESTTDSVAQMREGLGLAPDPAAEPTVAAETSAAAESVTPPAESATAAPVTAEAPVEAAGGRPRGPDGKFLPVPKPSASDPLAEERAARTVAETERDALKRRLEEVTAGARPAPVETVPAAPTVPAIDLDTYRDPAVTTRYTAQRTALGAEPKQEDFEDYNEYRRQERAYDRKLAAIDAQETVAHQRAAETAQTATQAAHAAATRQFATFAEGQTAAKARHADYDEVMAAGSKIPFRGQPHAEDIQRALVDMGADGGEVVYYLAKNPAELAKLHAQPSPHAAIVALGRVAVAATSQPSSATAPSGATQSGPVSTIVTAPAKPVSKAPEPQGTMLGGGPTTAGTNLEAVKTQQEYNRIRNGQERAKRGR